MAVLERNRSSHFAFRPSNKGKGKGKQNTASESFNNKMRL